MRKFLLALYLIALPGWVFAQSKVEGYVKDSDGIPLPGVNVTIKGTTSGTITDVDGYYSISDINEDAILTFSFMGMKKEEVKVDGFSNINMVLTEDSQSLDEVIVVGYGSVKRANLAGAVSDIDAEELEEMPVVNLSSALEGKLSGVRISIPSGKPGTAATFQIREASTKSVDEEPLFVIDGIIRDKDAFDLLDPSEVASISILKDASAAVYGAAAAGGVVLVSTKKGEVGKTRINYTGSYGITQPINITEMCTAWEHAKMLNDGYDIISKKPEKGEEYYTDDELLYFRDSIPNGGYNWLDQAWQSSMVTRHSLNVSGGSEKITYFIGGNYIHETGSIQDLWVKKYNLRSNIQTEITKNLSASFEVSINNKQNRTPVSPDENGDLMGETFRALLQNPKFIPPTIDGYPVKQDQLIDNNPYAIWDNNNYSKEWLSSYTASVSLSYKFPFIKGLQTNVRYSQSKGNEYSKRYETAAVGYKFETAGGNNHIIRPDAAILIDSITGLPAEKPFADEESLQESTTRSSSYQTNIQLSYNRTFGKHEVGALAVCEFSEDEENRVGWKREGDQLIDGYDLEWAFEEGDKMLTPNRDQNGAIGYIGRLNYNFDSRYIIEFTCRYESSTRFSPEYQWGFFPSLLLGWVVSEESFFKKATPVVNFLKIRGSAGKMGNDNFPSFQYLLRYKPRNEYVLFGDQLVNNLNAENYGIVNDKLLWQTTYSYNGGIDLRLFESLLNLSFDGFYEYTTDMLDQVGTMVPPTAGMPHNSKVKFNYGKAKSYGYEIELGINKKLPWNFEIGVSGNLSWAEERLIKVAQSPTAIGTWHDELSLHQDNLPGAISTGIIRDQEEIDDILMDNPNYLNNNYLNKDKNNTETNGVLELGMLNFLDLRGSDGSEGPDGVFNFAFEEDRTVISKHNSPTYTYGVNFNARWKEIRLDMTFSGGFGHNVVYDKNSTEMPTDKNNVPAFMKDYWTPENPDAPLPSPVDYGMAGENSTFWMRDGHTLRLTDLSLSYRLPTQWSSTLNISSLKIFFNTKYLWTIINPFDYKDANLGDYNGYPMTRSYNFGVNLSL